MAALFGILILAICGAVLWGTAVLFFRTLHSDFGEFTKILIYLAMAIVTTAIIALIVAVVSELLGLGGGFIVPTRPGTS